MRPQVVPNLVRSNYHPYELYKERNDIYKEYVSNARNFCQNVVIFEYFDLNQIKMFWKLCKRLYHASSKEITNNKLKFYTIASPIDRAHFYSLSLYFGRIDYYHYELEFSIYGHETYTKGHLVNKIESDSQEFLYDNAEALDLLTEVEAQVNTVMELVKLNDMTIDDIVDNDEILKDENGEEDELSNIMIHNFWFFDWDGLKKNVGG